MPVEVLERADMRWLVCPDRKSDGRGAPVPEPGCAPVRHVVTRYHGTPLVVGGDGGDALVAALRAAASAQRAEGAVPLPCIESPNCADVLELRGRWDAEVLLPRVLARLPDSARARAQALMEQYRSATAAVRAAYDAGERLRMRGELRSERYRVFSQVAELLAEHAAATRTADEGSFSCVNLSYDYDECRGELDLGELDRTVGIICGAFTAAAEP